MVAVATKGEIQDAPNAVSIAPKRAFLPTFSIALFSRTRTTPKMLQSNTGTCASVTQASRSIAKVLRMSTFPCG